jgi:hypothetical protein
VKAFLAAGVLLFLTCNMEAGSPGDGNDSLTTPAKRKKTGRPPGSKRNVSKRELIVHQRSSAISSVKEKIGRSSILVILPDPSSFLIPVNLASKEEFKAMDSVSKIH